MFYLFGHCCQKQQQCNGNIRLCRMNCSTSSIRQCSFDIVVGVDGASTKLLVASTLLLLLLQQLNALFTY